MIALPFIYLHSLKGQTNFVGLRVVHCWHAANFREEEMIGMLLVTSIRGNQSLNPLIPFKWDSSELCDECDSGREVTFPVPLQTKS